MTLLLFATMDISWEAFRAIIFNDFKRAYDNIQAAFGQSTPALATVSFQFENLNVVNRNQGRMAIAGGQTHFTLGVQAVFTILHLIQHLKVRVVTSRWKPQQDNANVTPKFDSLRFPFIFHIEQMPVGKNLTLQTKIFV